MTAFQKPLHALEDCLQDLRAITKLALHASETTEPAEFGAMRDSINTALYLILEKIEKIDRTHETMWHTELAVQDTLETLQ